MDMAWPPGVEGAVVWLWDWHAPRTTPALHTARMLRSLLFAVDLIFFCACALRIYIIYYQCCMIIHCMVIMGMLYYG